MPHSLKQPQQIEGGEWLAFRTSGSPTPEKRKIGIIFLIFPIVNVLQAKGYFFFKKNIKQTRFTYVRFRVYFFGITGIVHRLRLINGWCQWMFSPGDQLKYQQIYAKWGPLLPLSTGSTTRGGGDLVLPQSFTIIQLSAKKTCFKAWGKGWKSPLGAHSLLTSRNCTLMLKVCQKITTQ